jgi:hypothetical protein
MLSFACKEARIEGHEPMFDPAVAIIAGRIGLFSPTDTMSYETWSSLVSICEEGLTAKIVISNNAVQ